MSNPTDWRALCAELLYAWRVGDDIAGPMNRAATALAQPEPFIVTVKGLNWPATLGDFTLVGPADNQGAWRWYERPHPDGATERVRVDYQLQPLGLPTPTP